MARRRTRRKQRGGRKKRDIKSDIEQKKLLSKWLQTV